MAGLTATTVLALGACGSGEELGSSDFDAMENKAKIVKDIPPDALIEGTFESKIRVYGYIVEAKKGARITVHLLEATAGADAEAGEGAALDTVLRVNGPYSSNKKPGKLIVESDDAADGTVSAPPATFDVQKDGKYLVSFSSWEDTGKGKYRLKLSCEGTDFQCRRPAATTPCKAASEDDDGPLFIQGSTVLDEVWDRCEIIILESVTVPAGKTLTIKPGVTVKGNFLNPANGNQPNFGNVRLIVQGTLQAAGTAENPIAFTSFKKDRGWAGILLQSQENHIAHAVVERASTGIEVASGASVTVDQTLVQGVLINNQRSDYGIRVLQVGELALRRSVVTHNNVGLLLSHAQKVTVEDSVLRSSAYYGAQIDGASPTTGCASPMAAPQVVRDPVFTNVDVFDNTLGGVFVNGSDVLVQISQSNLIGNAGPGLLLQARWLHPESFIRDNNVHDNYGSVGRDVVSYHQSGRIDISQNYWKDISDPELSANWQFCGNNPNLFTFTGFKAKRIKTAGARPENLSEPLRKFVLQPTP
jgi:hypothetical protein